MEDHKRDEEERAKLSALREEYRTASPERQKEIDERWERMRQTAEENEREEQRRNERWEREYLEQYPFRR